MERREDIDSYRVGASDFEPGASEAASAEAPTPEVGMTRRNALLGIASIIAGCSNLVKRPEASMGPAEQKLRRIIDIRWEQKLKPEIEEFCKRFERVRFDILEDDQLIYIQPQILAAEASLQEFIRQYTQAFWVYLLERKNDPAVLEEKAKFTETVLRPALEKFVFILIKFRKACETRFNEFIKQIDDTNFEEEALKYRDLAVLMISKDQSMSSMTSLPHLNRLAKRNSAIKVMKLTIGDVNNKPRNAKALEGISSALGISIIKVPTYIILNRGKVVNIVAGTMSKPEQLEESIIKSLDRYDYQQKNPQDEKGRGRRPSPDPLWQPTGPPAWTWPVEV